MEKETLTPEQQEMIDQVAATMALEDMALTPAAYENLRQMATGEQTFEQLQEKIKAKYDHTGESS